MRYSRILEYIMLSEWNKEIEEALSSPAEWSLKEARRIAIEVCAERNVRVIFFGSRARGNNRPASDLDIALDGKGGLLPPNLKGELSERYEMSLIPYRVDVVDLSETTQEFRDEVEKEGVEWIG
jgi:predicted nucleotidyltransferase